MEGLGESHRAQVTKALHRFELYLIGIAVMIGCLSALVLWDRRRVEDLERRIDEQQTQLEILRGIVVFPEDTDEGRALMRRWIDFREQEAQEVQTDG